MKIDGQCHCGNISYEAEVDPATARICHCTDCQVLSGTAFRTVVSAKDENFTLLRGNPKTYIKTAESGAKREQAFCPDCGMARRHGVAAAKRTAAVKRSRHCF